MNSKHRVSSNSVAVWKDSSTAIVYDAELLGKQRLSAKHDLFDANLWQQSRAITQQAGGRGGVLFIAVGDSQWVLRHYRRGGLIGKLLTDQYFWLGENLTRSFREWHLLRHLQSLGLPVPMPVAARYQRSGLIYRADLLTVAIDGVQTLTQRLEQRWLDTSIWQRIGVVLARFHAVGAQHADLNAHNILLDAHDAVYVLDFDRGQLRATDVAWRQAVLQRLRRSLDKLTVQRGLHFSDQDWQALIHAHDQRLQELLARVL
jgi:3-deoxy-D-manno-octulosonic acid kinase